MKPLRLLIVAAAIGGGALSVHSRIPNSIRSLWGVACVSATHCWAVGDGNSTGGDILVTADGGKSWGEQLYYAKTGFIAIACDGPSSCWALGYVTATSPDESVVYATTDGGTKWVQENLPANFEGNTIACPSTSHCWIGGHTASGVTLESIAATSDGGRTWRLQLATHTGDAMGQFAGIGCASAEDCVYVGANSLRTSDGGTTWAASKLPASGHQGTDVSCVAGTETCVANGFVTSADPADQRASIMMTSNLGTSWSTRFAPATGISHLPGVSCQHTLCVTVGQSYTESHGLYTFTPAIYSSTDSGSTWTKRSAAPAINELASVSCPTVDACFAVGSLNGDNLGAIVATTNGGVSWVSEAP